MNANKWHDLMTLFTIVILVDNRIYKEEVDTLIKTVKELNDTISPEIFMTESMAFEWFKSNRDRVKNIIVGKDARRNVRDILFRTAHLPDQKEILKSMVRIAQSDNDYHRSEHSIIKQAEHIWGVSL